MYSAREHIGVGLVNKFYQAEYCFVRQGAGYHWYYRWYTDDNWRNMTPMGKWYADKSCCGCACQRGHDDSSTGSWQNNSELDNASHKSSKEYCRQRS